MHFAILFVLAQVTTLSSPCDTGAGLRPSRDLYCIELFPANGISGPRGVVGLLQTPGPFTISVTAGGTPRLRPVIDLSDLPAPGSFGAYSTYVAWATTPVLDTIIKLGEVRNGRTLLREVALDRYLIIVSAERSAAVKERTGRLVLRGESASNRMRPPDILDFALGTGTGEAAEHHHEPDSLGWTMVPMPPGVPMPPIEHAMRPSVHAYLPADDPSLPLARPREVRTLKDGDTLQLEAGMVRRSLAGRSLSLIHI